MERGERRVRDRERHRRPVLLGHIEPLDRADRSARDPHVLAGHREAGVVEDGLDAVAARTAPDGGDENHDHRGRHHDHRDYGCAASHGPAGVFEVLQPGTDTGIDLSAGWVAPPGQRPVLTTVSPL